MSSQAEFPYRQFCSPTKRIVLPEYINKVFNHAPEAWKYLNEKLKTGDVTITDRGEGHGLTLANMLNIAIEAPLLEHETINPLHAQVTKARTYAESLPARKKELFNAILNHAYLASTHPLKQAFAQHLLPGMPLSPLPQKISTFIELSKRLEELSDLFVGKPER
ncbi:hypothetical protein KY319_00965 [Candidatus Woesearchaeota archaeon]|nr:hypothetical protein [Candidatus Woesearchaeota archaeon]